MPELPDVENYRRLLAAHLIGSVLLRIDVLDASVLRNTTPRHMEKMVERTFRHVDRRGKWLVAFSDGPALVLHFGMTGSLLVTPCGASRDRYDRVVLVGEHEEVRYRDPRKLGGVWLAEGASAVDDVIGPQGPDGRTVSRRELALRLGDRRGGIKPVLMDQRVIAGLGNMLSDEVLWRACVDPTRSASALDDHAVERLHRSLRDVLRRSVRAGRIPRTSSWLSSQRDEDQPVCPRCHQRLERRTIAGRTSLSCPICQR